MSKLEESLDVFDVVKTATGRATAPNQANCVDQLPGGQARMADQASIQTAFVAGLLATGHSTALSQVKHTDSVLGKRAGRGVRSMLRQNLPCMVHLPSPWRTSQVQTCMCTPLHAITPCAWPALAAPCAAVGSDSLAHFWWIRCGGESG